MSKQPNILFIMADDHAAKAISAYGSGLNVTANIDRLAKDGKRLDHCYVTNSLCTPSRAAILTGTFNHVNGVTTLDTWIDNRGPNVAKHLQTGGYTTAIIGKWHLGEGPAHEPTGFDHWSVIPGQGDYYDPTFIDSAGTSVEPGYVTDIITDKCIDWLEEARSGDKPFFLMCHHKAPHRAFQPHPKNMTMFDGQTLQVPETYDDDYRNRALAAREATMRVRVDLTYEDLGLVQPEGGNEHGQLDVTYGGVRKVPNPEDVSGLVLRDRLTGEAFTFADQRELHQFKYQRYIKRYLATVASIDESVGRLLDWLDASGQADNTIIVYTSDQGFFLGDHGWFDKRFIYEESFQMPFLIRYPNGFGAGAVDAMACNVDFAPTFLDYAGLPIPSYMQGTSLRPILEGAQPDDWQDCAYHRYWMHKDENHNAFAHYGLRTERWKLIYWYNEALGQAGAKDGDEAPEWELFDCDQDPLELFNLWGDPKVADVCAGLVRRLADKMSEIGDSPRHDVTATLLDIEAW